MWRVKRTLAERFWAKVKRLGPDDCWEWQGAIQANGYGRFNPRGNVCGAHRVAWALNHGKQPGKRVVRHSCDNRRCCNPRHLMIGSHADNSRDMVERGRHKPSYCRGENHGMARITIEDARLIKKLITLDSSNTRIARYVGVTPNHVSMIRLGRIWKHI